MGEAGRLEARTSAAAPRWGGDVVAQAVSGVAEHELTAAVRERARRLGPDTLRILDAVHLASALAANAQTVLTYDDRLATAARAVGLSVLALD